VPHCEDGVWRNVEEETGWQEPLATFMGRLPPVLSSRPGGAVEYLGEQEIRQLRLLGYVGDDPAGP
jgi:hypothetical protein